MFNENPQPINLIMKITFPIEDGPMSQNDRASIGCLQHSFDLTTCRAHAVESPGRIQREATKASEGPVVETQR